MVMSGRARQDDYIELSRALAEINYPCGRNELRQRASMNCADEQVLSHLELIPDRVYEGPDEALMFADDSERDRDGEP